MTKECIAIIAIINLSNEERALAEVISTGLGLGRVIDRATRRGVRSGRMARRGRTGPDTLLMLHSVPCPHMFTSTVFTQCSYR